MNCLKLQEMISPLIDGELSEALSAQLRAHLDSCSQCQETYHRMLAIDDRLKIMGAAQPDPRLGEAIKVRIARRKYRSETKEFLPLWIKVPLMASVVLLAVGAGGLAGESLSRFLAADQNDNGVELLVPQSSLSVANAVLDVGAEETVR